MISWPLPTVQDCICPSDVARRVHAARRAGGPMPRCMVALLAAAAAVLAVLAPLARRAFRAWPLASPSPSGPLGIL